ncbi:class I SAM-dependent rRNA methyltransferase [Streptococcus catagoni]|uniref:class I SAM-dependent rRNA methyltransferase n=1 Tax=Streptococcus catagoni TaxID=2654874 RepID=UPI00140C9DA3|nr:class I SAM-dependent rRNA methyltransferase [Streptococcus catagoni]
MNKLYINSFVEKKLSAGIQLLDERDFTNAEISDQLVHLYSKKNHFLGTAYLSKQNKGIGWFLGSGLQELSVSFFIELFLAAKEKRVDYAESALTNAYRLFNQDGDNFGGLTIDLYKDYAVFSWYNTFVYQNKALIVEAFQQVFPELKGAYEKIRFKNGPYESKHLYGKEAEDTFIVLENGVKYQVFLNDGLMTGIFLDQHQVRNGLVDGLAAGKVLLNMFSYTAAFSVAAAMGGASETVSVDLAKRSKELSIAHFKANGLDLEKHHFFVMDVFDYFRYAQRNNLKFDIIVIDPPSFARNKKQTFSVSKDYHKLISEALTILNPDGRIIASTNAANVSVDQFKKEIKKGIENANLQEMTLQQLPSDFQVNKADDRSNYLKVFTIKVEK